MIREFKNLIFYHFHGTRQFAVHDVQNVYYKVKRDLLPFGLHSLSDKTVLDLGCGQRFAFSLLASAEGARVTALDIVHVTPQALPQYFLNAFKSNGLKRAVKSTIRKLFFDSVYYRELERTYGKPLLQQVQNITFVTANPSLANYPLPDSAFDLIVSNAVLEHVEHVNKYFAEVNRLLVPGGLFYGIIHNYYSLSGGHNLQWAYPDRETLSNVPPWDHLRANLFPTHEYLNKLRPEEYQGAAASHLTILLFEPRDINHDLGGTEGERFLTPDLENELSQYPRELLLTRSYCIICRNEIRDTMHSANFGKGITS